MYLYCNIGYRSQHVAEILVKNGYDQVYNLEWGIMEWDLLNLALAYAGRIDVVKINADTSKRLVKELEYYF